MKSFYRIFNTTMLFIVLIYSIAFNQTNWTKEGMVIDVGDGGEWDDHFVSISSIIYDSVTSTFKLWYTGSSGPWGSKTSVGYATSPDGVIWTRDENNPVLESGPADTWDDFAIGWASVVKKDNTYHMWYSGAANQTDVQIGYAASPDGIKWTKHENNPVLTLGPVDGWEESRVYFPSVIISGDTFHMWYTGSMGDPLTAEQIGYATSPDGITWTKYAKNPVVKKGVSGTWDSFAAASPFVFYDGNTYHLWYTGGPPNSESFRIGYATSTDGTTWEKYPSNPILYSGSWDFPRVQDPRVLLIDSTYHMWYSGGGFFSWRIGYATDNTLLGINNILFSRFPTEYTLSQNYPNPFNPKTVIRYALPVTSHIDLSIYDILGQKVTTLISKKQPAGKYEVEWDASNFSSGVYLYKLDAGEYIETRKMILMK